LGCLVSGRHNERKNCQRTTCKSEADCCSHFLLFPNSTLNKLFKLSTFQAGRFYNEYLAEFSNGFFQNIQSRKKAKKEIQRIQKGCSRGASSAGPTNFNSCGTSGYPLTG
jgi:hypothetical protein